MPRAASNFGTAFHKPIFPACFKSSVSRFRPDCARFMLRKRSFATLPIKDLLLSIRLSSAAASPFCASAQSRSFVCFMGVFLLCGRLQDSQQTASQLFQCFRRGSFHTRNAVQHCIRQLLCRNRWVLHILPFG